MRSFEIPAMRGCMLTEDTPTHRDLFGMQGEAVWYFQSVDELVSKTWRLLDSAQERVRLADAAHTRIIQGGHTYRDRLEYMLGVSPH